MITIKRPHVAPEQAVRFAHAAVLGASVLLSACTLGIFDGGRISVVQACYPNGASAPPDSVGCVRAAAERLRREGEGPYPYVARFEVSAEGVRLLVGLGPPQTHAGGGALVLVERNGRVRILERYQ